MKNNPVYNKSLKCCTCGATETITAHTPLLVGIELYNLAQKAGWVPSVDNNLHRTLLFCSEKCRAKQLTKSGAYRKKLIKTYS